MLVLSRKRGEKVVIDNKITITLLEVQGDKVRLGIAAPRKTPVHRYEIWAKIQTEVNDATVNK